MYLYLRYISKVSSPTLVIRNVHSRHDAPDLVCGVRRGGGDLGLGRLNVELGHRLASLSYGDAAQFWYPDILYVGLELFFDIDLGDFLFWYI